MADYAGAVAAIEARLAANWATTPIRKQNDATPVSWPPLDGSGNPSPWVQLEVLQNEAGLRAIGVPDSHLWLDRGTIYVHVFVPVSSGLTTAMQYAVQVGEIFRAAAFYDDGQGSIVRSWAPRVLGADSGSDDGLWFRVTTAIPFEFYYRG